METLKTTHAQFLSLKKLVLLILPALLLFNCNPEDNITEPIDFETSLIAKDNLYGAGDEGINQQNLVITDQNAWDTLMTQMNSVNNVTEVFSETAIDFSIYKVVAVFDVVRGNGGHQLDLNIVEETDHIAINITHIVPEGLVTFVMTQPYHIVKIPITDLPIVFE